jgi:RNA polymerase sigma-70 factor (ECF subfamily)
LRFVAVFLRAVREIAAEVVRGALGTAQQHLFRGGFHVNKQVAEQPTIDLAHEFTCGFAARCVRRKSRQLVGRAGLTASDREDVEQELRTRLLESVSTYDGEKAHWNVFVTTVIERQAAKLLRDLRAEKRDHRRISSLSQPVEVEGDGCVELGEVIGQEHLDARRLQQSLSDLEYLELKTDVGTVLADLPEELRDICERLKEQSMSEVARELDMPRTTLQRYIARIRASFESAGF